MKRTLFSSVFIVSMFSLISCGTVPQKEMTNNLTSTQVISTSTALITESPTPTPLPTFTLAPFSTPTLFPFSLMGNIRIVYSQEDRLFIQENQNQPVQLINNGKDVSSPRFINNGQEIIFYKDSGDLYSINFDGSGEQKLISQEWLDTLGTGTYVRATEIAGSRRLLLETVLYPEKNNHESSMRGLFTVDIDTGNINELMEPHLVNKLLAEISPNGKLLVIASAGRIDIYDINGTVIYHNIMNYKASTPHELEPMINWLPDSSGVIAALPKNKNVGWAYAYYYVYDVWTYKLGEDAVSILFDDVQPILTQLDCGNATSISPDGSLFVFSQESKIYLGHLRDGHIQLIGSGGHCFSKWSPDSRRFIYENNSLGYFIGSVDGAPPIPIDYRYAGFVAWIDSHHYICFANAIQPEKGKFFVVEVVEDAVLVHETGISLPGSLKSYDVVIDPN